MFKEHPERTTMDTQIRMRPPNQEFRTRARARLKANTTST